jgi:hypothetical protein
MFNIISSQSRQTEPTPEQSDLDASMFKHTKQGTRVSHGFNLYEAMDIPASDKRNTVCSQYWPSTYLDNSVFAECDKFSIDDFLR